MKIFMLAFSLLCLGSIQSKEIEEIFTELYHTNAWKSWPETKSGEGSLLKNTKNIRKVLPIIIQKYNIQSILDLPCGDFNWMQKIDLSNIKYLGGDIVQALVEDNQKKYSTSTISFSHIDAVKYVPKGYDLIICRDLLLHLSYENIFKVISNIKNSNARYLLLSYHQIIERVNGDIENGDARYINVTHPRYGLGDPLFSFYDDFDVRHMGLWDLRKLN
ncbi:class I SAM-dependent methyltransferase [bacterium]|nr:class I SAM-dependent methyltransferase [bacterium]